MIYYAEAKLDVSPLRIEAESDEKAIEKACNVFGELLLIVYVEKEKNVFRTVWDAFDGCSNGNCKLC